MSPVRRISARVLPVLLVPATLLLAGCGGPDLIERLSQRQWGLCGTVIVVLDILALVDLVGGDTYGLTGKVLWALLIVFFPVGGVILYVLFAN